MGYKDLEKQKSRKKKHKIATNKGMNKLWYVQTIKYYKTEKRNKIQLHLSMWRIFMNINVKGKKAS